MEKNEPNMINVKAKLKVELDKLITNREVYDILINLITQQIGLIKEDIREKEKNKRGEKMIYIQKLEDLDDDKDGDKIINVKKLIEKKLNEEEFDILFSYVENAGFVEDRFFGYINCKEFLEYIEEREEELKELVKVKRFLKKYENYVLTSDKLMKPIKEENIKSI